jgi:hypothetical protein
MAGARADKGCQRVMIGNESRFAVFAHTHVIPERLPITARKQGTDAGFHDFDCFQTYFPGFVTKGNSVFSGLEKYAPKCANLPLKPLFYLVKTASSGHINDAI